MSIASLVSSGSCLATLPDQPDGAVVEEWQAAGHDVQAMSESLSVSSPA